MINPSRPDPGRRDKINLDFYFRTCLWCLKRFYEGLKGLHKTLEGTIKKLIFILIQLTEMHDAGKVNNTL